MIASRDLARRPIAWIRRGAMKPKAGRWDEVLGADGQVRAHWGACRESLAAMGHAGLARRWQQGRRLIHDNGITYNVYSDPQATARPWPLDPIPLVMDPAEWKAIEAAVCSGPRCSTHPGAISMGRSVCLREGLLPRRWCFPIRLSCAPAGALQPPGGVYLHLYAADMARSPDGQWWVLADRTQAPSGAGYALENRLVTTRVLPDVFRSSQRAPPGAFFPDLPRRAAAAGPDASAKIRALCC